MIRLRIQETNRLDSGGKSIQVTATDGKKGVVLHFHEDCEAADIVKHFREFADLIESDLI